MKKYVKAGSSLSGAKSFTLFDMLPTFSPVDDLNIQNQEGSIWSGTVREFNELGEYDYLTDQAGNEFEKEQIMTSPVSLIRPYKDVLIVAVDT